MSDPGTWTLNRGLSKQEPVCTIKKIKQPQQHGFLLSPEMVENGACGMTQESGTAGNVSILDSAVSGWGCPGCEPSGRGAEPP